FHHALDVGADGDVGLDRDRLRALGGAFGGHRLRVALVGDNESRAFSREQQRGRPPDAGASAGDDADLVLEAHDQPSGPSGFLTQLRMWRATATRTPL